MTEEHDPAFLRATPADHEHRLAQLEALLDEAAAEALILGQASHAAWALCGADLRIQISSERAWGFVVVHRKWRKVVTWVMDARRFQDEELPEDVKVVAQHWDEESPETVARRLAGEGPVLSDCGLPRTEPAAEYLREAQYPLTDLELRRAEWIGARLDAGCRVAAEALEPGTTEYDAAALLTATYLRDGLAVDEMMIGFDERIGRYRHPVARGARLDRLALLHPTVNRWGQHAIATRMVSLGKPDDELVERFAVVSEVEGWSVAMTRPGVAYSTILDGQREIYSRRGYPRAWRDHWQGGQTGFALCEIAHVERPSDTVPERGLFNWFITLPGAKKEETTLSSGKGGRILTLAGAWPTQEFGTSLGPASVADLLIR